MVPLRVDFGGGWLDVPHLAQEGAFIVNCAITPMVSLEEWCFERNGGLGGSAAWALLQNRDAFKSESSLGVGWQDPAIILETGICAWRSGPQPVLEVKVNPDFLVGKLALYWCGHSHHTPDHTNSKRDYDIIRKAGAVAKASIQVRSLSHLFRAVSLSYAAQLGEGMFELPDIPGALAKKYCGGGWGGYALYCFDNQYFRDNAKLLNIEPYMRTL